jgi:hypothetical protein
MDGVPERNGDKRENDQNFSPRPTETLHTCEVVEASRMGGESPN